MIEKINKDYDIVELNLKNEFTIVKGNSCLKIYDKKIILKLIDKNFNKKYQELLYLVMEIEEDSTDTDNYLALLKIDELKNLIIEKYRKFIPNLTLQRYLELLEILSERLKNLKKGKSR